MSESNLKSLKCLVLGGRHGLLGQSLVRVLQAKEGEVAVHGREDADVLNFSALEDYLAQQNPDVVFNTIAYTAVDNAEDDKENAYRLNKDLPCALGKMSVKLGFKLVHYSTDFVFDGRGTEPYTLSDEPNPLSVYGASKLAGENALLRAGAEGVYIIRTAWLFGPGKKNFVQTILNLARERNQLKVIHDQIGSPTYTPDLAKYSCALIEKGVHGIYHIVNSGQASWCELAAEAVNMAGMNCNILAIPTSEFPLKAVRPGFSVLNTDKFTARTGISPRPWIQALREYVFEYLNEQGYVDQTMM